MRIEIETIDHAEQRYPTVGDWFYRDEKILNPKGTSTEEVLHIKVSKLGNWRYEALIAVHELVEVILCQHAGISQAAVDKFDIAFEKTRPEGNEDEPGDATEAPYRKQHCLATAVERMLAAELDVAWYEYQEKCGECP